MKTALAGFQNVQKSTVCGEFGASSSSLRKLREVARPACFSSLQLATIGKTTFHLSLTVLGQHALHFLTLLIKNALLAVKSPTMEKKFCC